MKFIFIILLIIIGGIASNRKMVNLNVIADGIEKSEGINNDGGKDK